MAQQLLAYVNILRVPKETLLESIYYNIISGSKVLKAN